MRPLAKLAASGAKSIAMETVTRRPAYRRAFIFAVATRMIISSTSLVSE